MRLTVWNLLWAVVALSVCADAAMAWGPATHIGLGRSLLDNLGVLPGAVAAVLGRHGLAYLYGNIAADVVFAKRLSRVKQFCHHWSSGFALLDAAEDDKATAFAYGYLSHLAADTVAHGKYVPRQVMMSQCSVNFGHLYWELRADSMAPGPSWDGLRTVLSMDHQGYHRSMARLLKGTFLPYDLNRILFDGINSAAVRPAFRGTMKVWGRCSRWYLPSELLEGYSQEALDRMMAILSDGSNSVLMREDPNGTSALMHAHVQRRDLRRMKRRGIRVDHRLLEASRGLAPRVGTVDRDVAVTLMHDD